MGVYDQSTAPITAAPWPVINAKPSFTAVLRNITFSDWLLSIGVTTFGAAYGFAAGAQPAPDAPSEAQNISPAPHTHPFFFSSSFDAALCLCAPYRQAAAPAGLLLHGLHDRDRDAWLLVPRVLLPADGAAPQPVRVRARGRPLL